jgi:hypothetical protein
MATTRTKAVVALGLLDLTRQAAHAWNAHEQARRDRSKLGADLVSDARRLVVEARDHVPELPELRWGVPPWRRRTTLADRARTWAPTAAVVALASVAVIVAARIVARRQPHDPDAVTTDSKVVGAVVAGSEAIDAAVTKTVESGSAVAAGTAAGVAAGSAAVKQAAVKETKDQLDTRVVAPAKHKVKVYGSLGLGAITLYVVLVAAATVGLIALLS